MGWAVLPRVQDVAQARLACCLARPGFQVCWIVAKTWERQASPSHHLDTKDTHLPHPSVHNNIVFVFVVVYALAFYLSLYFVRCQQTPTYLSRCTPLWCPVRRVFRCFSHALYVWVGGCSPSSRQGSGPRI